MLKQPSSRRKSGKEKIELNLVPILDTMVALISFLLFTTSFIAIVSVQSPFPEISREDVQKKLKEKPLQLTVTLREKEVEIWSPFDRIPAKTLPNGANGQVDIKALHDAVVPVKQKFPLETKVVLVPYAGASYDTLIAVMDAIRLAEPGDPPIFSKNATTGIDEAVKTLFPEVIFGNLLGGYVKNRSIRGRRGRRKLKQGFELQLTSMMDVLIIIVVFLLKSYATSTNTFNTVPGLKLPISKTQDVPPDSLQLIITPESMTFENDKILEFLQTAGNAGSADGGYAFKGSDLDEGGRRVVPLFDALMKARQKAELLRTKSSKRDEQGKPLPFEGVLAIQADKRVQYDTIRKIMYTAATAGYRIFRFLAMQRDS